MSTHIDTAILGTGLLGSGMAKHFLKRGVRVRVWNRTVAKARALEAEGAVVAATPAECVTGIDRVHFVLPDDTVVDTILDQVTPALEADAIVIDHSTTLPDATRRRFERMAAKGIRFVHAPVFMSPAMAAEGSGLMLVSGPARDVEAVRAELAGMTGELWDVGERPDLSAAFKLFGNCMLFAISAGLNDVMAMARANAIDPLDALQVFSKFQAGNVINFRGPRMARGEVTPASFELAMARKDVGLMTAAAGKETLIALPAVAKRMDELIAAGHGQDDLAALGLPKR